MQWLTLTEIGRRARSKKGALQVSYEHWNQLYQVTAKELKKALKEKDVSLSNEHCGLCRYFGSYRYGDCQGRSACPKCLLSEIGECCYDRCTLYWYASEAKEGWLANSTNSNWWAWKRAAKTLRDKLKELMDKTVGAKVGRKPNNSE